MITKINHIKSLPLLALHSLGFAISFILLIIIFSPVFLYRWALSKLHLFIHRENVGIVSPLSSTYIEFDGNLKSAYNLVANLKFHGHIPLDRFISRVSAQIVNVVDENGSLLHPELQQCIKLWGGYSFWVKNPNFDICHHVLSYEQLIESNSQVFQEFPNNKTRNEQFCQDFLKLYVQQKLSKHQSPWEMIVINGILREENNKRNMSMDEGQTDTLIVFKFQHCLADGHSVFNTIMRCADSTVPRYEPPLPSKFEQHLAKLAYPFLAPIHMGMVKFETFPSTPWDKIPNTSAGLRNNEEEERSYGKTKLISMSEMKNISKTYKIPFTAVLLGILGNAIRAFLIKHNQAIPPYIVCGISLPTPNHPEGLVNDWYFTFIKIPLQGTSQLDLIKQVAKQFPSIRRSTLYVTRQILLKLTYMLPTTWKWKIKIFQSFYAEAISPWPTMLSSMPGPKETVVVDGKPLVEMNYIYNRAHGNSCLMTMLSYKDEFQLWLSIHERITFGSGVGALVSQVNQQFENLNESLVNNVLDE